MRPILETVSGQLNNAGDLATSKRNIKAVNQIHLKYEDDMSLAESVNLKELLVDVPDRAQLITIMLEQGMYCPKKNLLYTTNCWRLL